MDPLAQLKDIHLPQEVGLWPLAWGWWVVLILLVGGVMAAFLLHRRRQQRNRYRAAAVAAVQQATAMVRQDQQIAQYLQQLSVILRRAALSGCGNSFQPNLKNEAWLRWLDDQCPETRDGFSHGAGRALLTGPYEANPQADIEALHQLVILWLQKHRNQWQTVPAGKAPQTPLLPTRAQPPVNVTSKEARDA